ncbi:hypothetical protein [Asticcacaulis sp.]|uniref:hypothetical protein n=1 Tax=Asticcacaulis sp. TaxID=1872648 RepID=UPI003F7BC294
MQNAESLLVMPTSAQLLERMMASADRPDRLIPAIDMVTFIRPTHSIDGDGLSGCENHEATVEVA